MTESTSRDSVSLQENFHQAGPDLSLQKREELQATIKALPEFAVKNPPGMQAVTEQLAKHSDVDVRLDLVQAITGHRLYNAAGDKALNSLVTDPSILVREAFAKKAESPIVQGDIHTTAKSQGDIVTLCALAENPKLNAGVQQRLLEDKDPDVLYRLAANKGLDVFNARGFVDKNIISDSKGRILSNL